MLSKCNNGPEALLNMRVGWALLVWMVASSELPAQYGHIDFSLESRIARADLVVRGFPVKLKLRDQQPKKHSKWTDVVLKVEETLKGEKLEEVSFGDTRHGRPSWGKALDERHETLWFFVKTDPGTLRDSERELMQTHKYPDK